jgi:hypothetical protein
MQLFAATVLAKHVGAGGLTSSLPSFIRCGAKLGSIFVRSLDDERCRRPPPN